jgi:hypothetical protein
MIEPWQVWKVNVSDTTSRHMLVVSSEFQLRLNVGRWFVAVPLNLTAEEVAYRPVVIQDGERYAVVTDQFHTILSVHLAGQNPQWVLPAADIEKVQRTLKHMVAF